MVDTFIFRSDYSSLQYHDEAQASSAEEQTRQGIIVWYGSVAISCKGDGIGMKP